MGDITEGVLEGYLCQMCQEIIDEESPGFPRTCAGCESQDPDDNEYGLDDTY